MNNKELEFQVLQDLDKLKLFNYYIYRNTYELNKQQRLLNLAIILQIISVCLILLNIFISNINFCVFIISFVSSIIGISLGGYGGYRLYYKRQSKEDERAIKFSAFMIAVRDNIKELEMAKKYKIDLNDNERIIKINAIKVDFNTLRKVWEEKKISKKKPNNLLKFLEDFGYDITMLIALFTRIKEFMNDETLKSEYTKESQEMEEYIKICQGISDELKKQSKKDDNVAMNKKHVRNEEQKERR